MTSTFKERYGYTRAEFRALVATHGQEQRELARKRDAALSRAAPSPTKRSCPQ